MNAGNKFTSREADMEDTKERQRSGGVSLDEATDQEIVHEYIRRLSGGGEDGNRPGLRDTARRVVDSWDELFFGYGPEEEVLDELMVKFPEEGADEMVVVKGVKVWSFCEHHLLPFVGTAAVGYLPAAGEVLGLSKLARLVQYYAARLSTQERIGQRVVRPLTDGKRYAAPGAGCIIEATHLCMCARGAQAEGSSTVTSALAGKFRTEPQTRAEFLKLAGY